MPILGEIYGIPDSIVITKSVIDMAERIQKYHNNIVTGT